MVDHERVQADVQAADSAVTEKQNTGINDTSDIFSDDMEIDMAALLEETMPTIESGQIIVGRVLKVNEDDVVVDIGSKSEGIIPLREFFEDGKDPNVFVGMDVEVMLLRAEGSDGLPILSRQKAKERLAKKKLRQSFKNGEAVNCVVREILRGGFQVDVNGLRGFIPFSQMGPGARTAEDQKALVGQTIEAKILEMKNKRDLILSQRRAIDEKREKLRKETLQSLKEGYWVKGVVKNLTDFGAFVDLGGIDGLLHVKDMSWGHIAHPRELVKVGDEIEILVMGMEGERISLGLKQKTPDPWLFVEDKYPGGSVVSGAITSMTKYGAFVGLEDGVEGLIHISEMSWTKRIKHPSELLQVGEEIRVKVLGVDCSRQRISLSLRQTTVDPWTLAKANYPTGSTIEGEVTGMTDFGAFIRLPEGVDGMIHVSDLSWAEKVSHPKHILKKGDKVKAKVLEIDPSKQRISLGLKQLQPDPWDIAAQNYAVGSAHKVKITRITDFGAFVELERGIEGLAHISVLGVDKGKKIEEFFSVGDEHTMKIIKFDRGTRKISMSLKDYVKEQEKKEVQKYMSDVGGTSATLGEMLGVQMQALMDQQEEEAPEEAAPAPVEETVSAETPAEEAPVEEASAEESAPVEETVSAEAPAEEAVAEETVVEEAPAEEAVAEETVVEEAPAEEAVAEETVVEEAPAEETAAEESPVEETPAEEEPVSVEASDAPTSEDSSEKERTQD